MSMVEVFKLAQERNCVLKIMQLDGTFLYWVENHHFIGKPYEKLDELVGFIKTLPVVTRRTPCEV